MKGIINWGLVVVIFIVIILAVNLNRPAMVTGPGGSMLEVGMSVDGMLITGSYSFIPYPSSPLSITNRYYVTVPDFDTATCKMDVTRVHDGDITVGTIVGEPTIKPGYNGENQLKCKVPVSYGKFDMKVTFALEKDSAPSEISPPATWNFDPARDYTKYEATETQPRRVWQYVEEYDGWYVYSDDGIANDNLIITAGQWEMLFPEEQDIFTQFITFILNLYNSFIGWLGGLI